MSQHIKKKYFFYQCPLHSLPIAIKNAEWYGFKHERVVPEARTFSTKKGIEKLMLLDMIKGKYPNREGLEF